MGSCWISSAISLETIAIRLRQKGEASNCQRDASDIPFRGTIGRPAPERNARKGVTKTPVSPST